jgi:hypothetical protein
MKLDQRLTVFAGIFDLGPEATAQCVLVLRCLERFLPEGQSVNIPGFFIESSIQSIA